jgi:hypothetical protein
MLIKSYRLMAPEPGESGSTPVDRGDMIEDLEKDIDPDDPDGKLADQEAIKADPAVKELEADLISKDDDPKKKDSRIPLSRHKEILEKERESRAALERQLAQYQQGNQIADMNAELTAAENNIIKMEKEYTNLLADGELEKAATLMQQIRKTERDMTEAKSDMKIHAAEVRATERARYNTSLERIESAFPSLNPDHDDFDAEAMAEVVDLKEAYQLKGLTPTMALQKAVKMIVEPRTSRQEIATSSTPRVTEKDVAAERKTAAVDKATKAISKTPPSLERVGLNSDKLGGGEKSAAAVIAMSQKEFASLGAEALAKLRGDEL